VRPLIRTILQKSALAKLVDLWGRAQLAAVPKQALDPTPLKSSANLSLGEIFSDPATTRRWEVDHSAIKAVFGDCDQYGGINPGDRRALYYLISALEPDRLLEIGTHIGASTLYLGQSLKNIGKGLATTVDVLDVNGRHGPWREAGLDFPPKDIVRRLGCSDHIAFATQPSLDFMRATRHRFDFVFLDGDHSPRAVYLEVAAALAILKPNGLILLHDYYPNGEPVFPDGVVRSGPYRAMCRIQKECPGISLRPLGELPWSTKQGTNLTSLALVMRA